MSVAGRLCRPTRDCLSWDRSRAFAPSRSRVHRESAHPGHDRHCSRGKIPRAMFASCRLRIGRNRSKAGSRARSGAHGTFRACPRMVACTTQATARGSGRICYRHPDASAGRPSGFAVVSCPSGPRKTSGKADATCPRSYRADDRATTGDPVP